MQVKQVIQRRLLTCNLTLINQLFNDKHNHYSAWFWNEYKAQAKYYYEIDLDIIRQRFNYKQAWQFYSRAELKQSPKWKGIVYKRIKSDLDDNDNYKNYIDKYNYRCGKARLIKLSSSDIVLIGNLIAYKNMLGESDKDKLSLIQDFISINAKVSYEHILWLRSINRYMITGKLKRVRKSFVVKKVGSYCK